ncbi:hypothetical protein [Salinarchaeum laminariae]|uniref:hypothetical protein n=1 Tax=Salinarchaeum laminariae TaxID=869888 RepID=UPI0020C09F16|nr:hypothetical protein [Salinarchaeum laminariae]
MDLIALLYKEAITVRRNLAPIVLLVVLDGPVRYDGDPDEELLHQYREILQN